MDIKRLSEKDQWESRWSTLKKSSLSFDPERPSFRESHQIFKKFLSKGQGKDFLEVGAYPGKYLWYFNHFFGYNPWGVEYVESCAMEAQHTLDDSSVPGRMIVDDFFNLDADNYLDDGGWDLVASFGFVEHFGQSEVAVAKHLQVTKLGGMVVVSIPNHAGWNGNIMHWADEEKWKQHNRMSLDDLIAAFNKAGGNEIMFSGHVGHIGFWNTCIYENAKPSMGALYPLLRAPLWLIEKLGCWFVPNNGVSSPEIIVIAKKIGSD